MTLTVDEIVKIAGFLVTISVLYALLRSRIKKEANMERDIKQLQEDVKINSGRLDSLEDHYRGIVDRLYDNLFPKKK